MDVDLQSTFNSNKTWLVILRPGSKSPHVTFSIICGAASAAVGALGCRHLRVVTDGDLFLPFSLLLCCLLRLTFTSLCCPL